VEGLAASGPRTAAVSCAGRFARLVPRRRGGPAGALPHDRPEAEGTVRFGLDGMEYEIDLNAEHAWAL
jgi:hypothetical protein